MKVKGKGEWNARKHGGTKRRAWRKIHIGIDEQTLDIQAAEFINCYISDAPYCPNCSTRSVTIRRSPVPSPMVPSTPASATMPLPPEARSQRYLPARTLSPGNPISTERSPAPKRCARQSASAVLTGVDGAAITERATMDTVDRCCIFSRRSLRRSAHMMGSAAQ